MPINRVEFSDFEALRHVVQDSTVDIVQIGNGVMSGVIEHMKVGTIGIATGSYTQGIRMRGPLSLRRWAFSVTGEDGPALVNHVEAKPGDQIITPPGHELYFVREDANRYAVALIEPDELFSFVEGLQPGAAELWNNVGNVLAVDPQTAAYRADTFQTLFTALQDPTLTPEAMEFYRLNLLELATGPMLSRAKDGFVRLKQSAMALVREVDRYLTEAGSRPVHIFELCSVFNVSKRTLHRAFHDVMGIGAITFSRNKRLGAVHSVLKQGGRVLVRDVAKQHGFLQPGKFTQEYRRLFGERPSETVQRAQYARILLAIWAFPLLTRFSATTAMIDETLTLC
ncbi:helix-turn-helix domain-containing protein [Bradyrhizobium sp. SRL28]|uniref:helix-turn-helix domain-containing protein n=1 Tax=Bradyrhizobium sp. SRL28 TaxID=2836178 RepID=UPI001BDEAF47|nr:helix-turn-helix domain-containing protein [Bradyrhizobium sp. SRL28]MBT1509470.1 helix-turn-helix domain-containing protein [Bradyrhizobium sp. SRL28]